MRARIGWIVGGWMALWLTAPHAQACEPEPGDPWFRVELQINKLALPPAVEVDARETKSGEPVLVVSNSSDIPIEIAGQTLASGTQIILAGEELEEALGTKIERRRGDNRPPQAAPPAGRQFLIVMIRQGQRLLLPGTMQYRLNTDYDPQRSARSLKRCERRNLIWMIVGIGVLLVMAFFLVRSTIQGRT